MTILHLASRKKALLFAVNAINVILTSTAQSSDSNFSLLDVAIQDPTMTLKDNNSECLEEWCELRNSSTSDFLWLRDDLWIVPLIVLSSLNVIVIICFEVYVLYKVHGTTSIRRHLFLGQLLLLGLFFCSITGFAFVPRAHWITCTVIRIGLGLAYTLVFATLLVKLVFLLSLHAGVYLPASYQGFLLFFILIVQVVIDVQWLVQRSTTDFISRTAITNCDSSVSNILLTLIYPMFLIFSITILSIKARGNHENHREALFIGIAIGFTIPLWVIWLLFALATEPSYHDASMGFGIVFNATIIFLVMFLPKGRQLAAMERSGLCPEDPNILSSPNPSIYTPSLLHIQPPIMSLKKQSTVYKPATITTPTTQDRVLYLSPPLGRVWKYSYPVVPHLPVPPLEDAYFYQGERRKTSFNPNMIFFRAPLY
ncbi:metabotropic glutamate receptor 2-like [Limulus polyphemus]|uniref:Metabotropic glutamate receptor 2-like n=1 Tax=Limulus polyphemus TaxID=6850 RepID=A0ABM1S8U0_LIMPO|nr:metabotropic glutamate receptor 2-like [Limulus polyphemus]XP_022240046.1 metabotropic glutamate receptor 2-like [Limulus polyphemus]